MIHKFGMTSMEATVACGHYCSSIYVEQLRKATDVPSRYFDYWLRFGNSRTGSGSAATSFGHEIINLTTNTNWGSTIAQAACNTEAPECVTTGEKT